MDNMVGQTIGGRYRFEAFLGRGGMASVYKVWDQQRSVSLAMKMLHSDLAEDRVFVRRFRREAETLSQLQHPNIIRFYGLEELDGLAFILIDFVEGSSLRTEIARSKQPMTPNRILEVLRPICSALNYAHKLGVVHCDMKPANILIDNAGKAYVSDFGIARMVESATTTTMTGAGTPAYMAPEQIRGERLSPQTDLYAMGIILYEMLTGGERPFTGEKAPDDVSTTERVRWEHLNYKPVFPPEFKERIAPQIAAVVMRCLEKEPAKRYASAMDMLLALERGMAAAVAEQLGIPYVEPEPPEDLNATDVIEPKPTVIFPPDPTVRDAPQPPTPSAPSAAGAAGTGDTGLHAADVPYVASPSRAASIPDAGVTAAAPPAPPRTDAPPPLEPARGRRLPMMIIGGIAVLALLVCGLSLLIVSQTNWWKEITGGRVVTVVAPSTKVAQESTATFTKTLKPTTQVPATPVPTTAVPTKRPPVIKSLRPIFTHTPTRTPTRVVGGPRIFGFEACARECNGVNAQQAFADPNGTSVIYYRYNYEKIPRGAHYVRSWSVEGKGEWIRYDCIWNGPEKGSFEANLQTSRKLFPGTWVLRIEVNGRPVLEEKIEVAGSSTYWMPVPTKDVCNQN